MDYAARFASGHSYQDFLARYGTEEHRRRWAAFYEPLVLLPDQRELLAGFRRQMNVLVLAGAWCGDCVNQCPIFQRFAEATDKLAIRYIDRDADPELAADLKICGGSRVPVAVFLAEDGAPVGRYGDRTLSKYRHMAAAQLGPSCPTGLISPSQELTAAVIGDWLAEFERVQWLLRLSTRLRQLHGD